ncbi:hypothetical protein OHA72_52625 [Dactylosporangium sp. NBC_01737]|nr:hypothetical protein OHA72_52625 [Dactylosporangium sp. NBC_01737]
MEPAALDAALRGDRAGLADRLLDAVTALWDATDPAEHRVAALDDATMRVLRDYLDCDLRVRVAEFLGGPDATQRATAAVGVIGGVIFTRYLQPVRSIAALPASQVRLLFGPALHAALFPRLRAPR